MAEACTECGIDLADGARFCRGCGATVEQLTRVLDEVAQESGEQICKACQFSNTLNASYCRNCGNSLSGDLSSAASAMGVDGKGQSGWLTAWKMPAVIGLFALLLVGATYFGWKQFRGEKDEEATSTTAAAAQNPAPLPTSVSQAYFGQVEHVRSVNDTNVFLAQLPPSASLRDFIDASRKYCTNNLLGACSIIITAAGKSFPAQEIRAIKQNESDAPIEGYARDGTIVAFYLRRSDDGSEVLELNCNLFEKDVNLIPTQCFRLNNSTSIGAVQDSQASSSNKYYIVAEANVRNRPTASSANKGKIARGISVGGTMITGEDGESSWFELAGGAGFVSAVNLSQLPPPRLATMLGDREFRAGGPLPLHASPSVQSAVIDTVPSGVVIYLVGITDNGYVEAKGRKGGVGYFLADRVDLRSAEEAARDAAKRM